MKASIIFSGGLFLAAAAASAVPAQTPCPGVTLVSSTLSLETRSIDLNGSVLQVWHGSATAASYAHLLDDGSILRPCVGGVSSLGGGGAGGRIQRINADDQVTWDFLFSSDDHRQHHCVCPMPSGNVLMPAWERKTREEALAVGYQGTEEELWPDFIVEVQPVGATSGIIVWEWHFWDHLVQDADSTLPGYGVVADHPELLDINFETPGISHGADITHVNAVDYNPDLDQIVFASPHTNEIYVIDHSTTTEEAAGHTGGERGHGGDFLYRWGNPFIYDRGGPEDQYFFRNHSARWIKHGLPGDGDILVFNNGDRPDTTSDYSSVVEIPPPRLSNSSYEIPKGGPFGPSAPILVYGAPGVFYGGPVQCGVQRLPNGNTLITTYQDSHIWEVTPEGTTVWEYYYSEPHVAQSLRYSEPFARVASGEAVDWTSARLLTAYPNPFQIFNSLRFTLAGEGEVDLAVYDASGRRVALLDRGRRAAGEHEVRWDGRDECGRQVAPGVYYARLLSGAENATVAMLRQ